ncbi:hypothetical protein PC122_g19887 [Phytophthora cactorum]|nr:hypothetical protein PC122_g19887 [Phytophthora cactorum]
MALLARFISLTGTNIRYVGLDFIYRMVRLDGDATSVKQPKEAVLKDADPSIVTNREELQRYAAEQMFKAMEPRDVDETTTKFGAYVLGEFGYIVCDDANMSGTRQFEVLHQHYGDAGVLTKEPSISEVERSSNSGIADVGEARGGERSSARRRRPPRTVAEHRQRLRWENEILNYMYATLGIEQDDDGDEDFIYDVDFARREEREEEEAEKLPSDFVKSPKAARIAGSQRKQKGASAKRRKNSQGIDAKVAFQVMVANHTHSHPNTGTQASAYLTTKTLPLDERDREDVKTLADARVSSTHITNFLNDCIGCKVTPQQTCNLIRSIMGQESGEDRLKDMLHALRQIEGSGVLVIQDQMDGTCGIVMQTKVQKMMFERWGDLSDGLHAWHE